MAGPREPDRLALSPMKLCLVISVEDTAFDAVPVRGGWDAGIRTAAALGYDGVELAIRDPAQVDAQRLRETLDDAGLTVPAIGTGQAYLKDGLSLTSDDAGVRLRALERVAIHLRLAAHLRAAVIIGLIRGRLAGDRERTDRRLLDALQQLLPAADRLGVRVLIEPINRYETDYLVTVDETLALIEQAKSPQLGVLADLFHMNIEEVSIEQALRRAGSRLGHVHAADSNRHAPGWGHLDFPRIVAVLRDIGYRGYLSAEILPRPDPVSAARQVVEYLRALEGVATKGGIA